ncbi:MAG: hypothetical protein RR290_02350 [Clostridia bacterium]
MEVDIYNATFPVRAFANNFFGGFATDIFYDFLTFVFILMFFIFCLKIFSLLFLTFSNKR